MSVLTFAVCVRAVIYLLSRCATFDEKLLIVSVCAATDYEFGCFVGGFVPPLLDVFDELVGCWPLVCEGQVTLVCWFVGRVGWLSDVHSICCF